MVSEGKREQNTRSPSVVCLRDVPKPFLSCSVPYLQFDSFGIEGEYFRLEVDSDGGGIGVAKLLIGEASDEGCFSDSPIADD